MCVYAPDVAAERQLWPRGLGTLVLVLLAIILTEISVK